MKSFLGTSTNNDCRACNGKGTESCEKGECIKGKWGLSKHPCIEGTCRKHCTACGEKNRHKEATDRCDLYKQKSYRRNRSIAGWVYVENSSITAANELYAKAEKEYLKRPEEEKEHSKNELIKLGIYQKDRLTKDDLRKGKEIKKILRSEHNIVKLTNGTIVRRSDVIEALHIQLGNPRITHEHLKALATLLVNAEKNGDPIQNRRPRFFTYDDKPSFNLISGLMQAKEDIWQKNSIIELQNAVERLGGNYRPSTPGSVATITELKDLIKDLQFKVEQLETTKATPQNIWTPISQNKEFKDLKTAVQNLEKNSPSTPQDISHNPSFKILKNTVQELVNNVPEDISQKITYLENTVQQLPVTPTNIPTKNSVLELLSKEIKALLTRKKENPEKEARVLNKISKIREFVEVPKIKIPQTVEECTKCHGNGLATGWTKHKSTSKGKHYYYNSSTRASQWDRPVCQMCKGKGTIQV